VKKRLFRWRCGGIPPGFGLQTFGEFLQQKGGICPTELSDFVSWCRICILVAGACRPELGSVCNVAAEQCRKLQACGSTGGTTFNFGLKGFMEPLMASRLARDGVCDAISMVGF
jgi:hypothetical protein